MNLSDDATFFLLRLVEQFPALWDMTLAKYADTTVKDTIWERIASEMNEEWPAYGPYDVSVASLEHLAVSVVPLVREPPSKDGADLWANAVTSAALTCCGKSK
ncbi:hypothetical protein HPB52_006837 [Rhipicephalus sanguineus]|uniref:MADF domain-containing protein n=1 Tax=Rhipicephalus sanguineus TaxID=34632 RepID=A0A9D4PXG9_RHISA|nr:hypothetical protein HPB52_006837 [Rhipicephalus sanguineus]